MHINQAFNIFQKHGGLRAAKIIINSRNKFSWVWVMLAALQLKHGVPVAKIIHSKWFYGLQFYTNKYTLDPRPDSETLVEAVLKGTRNRDQEQLKILDMGTGTGCLIVSLVKNIPNATGVGIDKSWQACRVARKNVKKFGLENKIKILQKTFTSHFTPRTSHFDIIVSNPPYIPRGDERVDDGAKHDPKMALYAKNNGLAAYKEIAKSAKKLLKENGKIYLEIGMGQTNAVRKIFETAGWKFENVFQDLSGIERVLSFTN